MIKWNLLGVTTCVEHPNFCFPRGTSVGYMIRVRWDQFNKKKKEKKSGSETIFTHNILPLLYQIAVLRALLFCVRNEYTYTAKKSKEEKISFLQNRTC